MMFGTITNEENRKLVDLDLREVVALVSIIIFIFWIGIYPRTFTGKTEASVNRLIQRVEKAQVKLEQDNRALDFKNILSLISSNNK
jgi:NADH-quinone oxidoreductase subunit M